MPICRGFLLGKFLPPHLGHLWLCDFARAYVDELTILVCSLPTEPIDGHLRWEWMKELYPQCRVEFLAEVVPQEPADHSDFWTIWRNIVKRFHPEPIDYVFASESYGHRLAAEVDAKFIPVDPHRQATSISGTRIRENPFAYWEFIPPPVRPYFTKTICLFGPESSGKSTLADKLARHFQTCLVPEYGRTYTEQFGVEIAEEDLVKIGKGHTCAIQASLRQANRIAILDTDVLLTSIWSEMLLGFRSDNLKPYLHPSDFYLLMDIDQPWVDDGTRYFPDQERRRKFYHLCEQELVARQLPFIKLPGSWDQKFNRAVEQIQARFLQNDHSRISSTDCSSTP